MFNHLRMEQRVREAVAQGARLRVRAAFWTAASVALAVAGVFFAAMAVLGGDREAGIALVAFAAATPPAVRGYWTWREVRRSDRRIIDVVSSFAERHVASRVDVSERPIGGDEPKALAGTSRVEGTPVARAALE